MGLDQLTQANLHPVRHEFKRISKSKEQEVRPTIQSDVIKVPRKHSRGSVWISLIAKN